jgi:hypothetical protein
MNIAGGHPTVHGKEKETGRGRPLEKNPLLRPVWRKEFFGPEGEAISESMDRKKVL